MGKFLIDNTKDNFIINEFEKHMSKINNNLSMIDQSIFWEEILNNKEQKKKFEYYRIVKTFLREKIILSVQKNFSKYLQIYGSGSGQNQNIILKKPVFSSKYISKIYSGNICLDTGSTTGSVSLHPRSIQILENGGLLIQIKQSDADTIWGDLNDKIINNNINLLLNNLELYLTSPEKCNERLEEIFEHFKHSQKKIEQTLSNAFNIN